MIFACRFGRDRAGVLRVREVRVRRVPSRLLGPDPRGLRLDLRQFTAWCRQLRQFVVRRTGIELFARDLETAGRGRATHVADRILSDGMSAVANRLMWTPVHVEPSALRADDRVRSSRLAVTWSFVA